MVIVKGISEGFEKFQLFFVAYCITWSSVLLEDNVLYFVVNSNDSDRRKKMKKRGDEAMRE